MKNGFEIDYANAPEVRELFDSKEIGERCTLTLVIQINEKDEKGVKGLIKEIGSEYAEAEEPGEPGEKDGKGSVTADAAEPIMVIMRAGSSEKAYA